MATGLLVIASGPPPVLAIGAAAVLGFGFSFPWSAVASTVLRRTPSNEHGTVVGILSAFYDLFVGMSSFTAGNVSEHFGYSAAFVMAAVSLIAAAVMGFFVFFRGSCPDSRRPPRRVRRSLRARDFCVDGTNAHGRLFDEAWPLKIATFNINNINKRLDNLTGVAGRSAAGRRLPPGTQGRAAAFPAHALRDLGYRAVWQGERSWNGVAILARDCDPVLTRSSLPGDPEDRQARYIEAAVNGILIASIYLPNGNPQPGPKFDYKLAWFERLIAHAANS